MVSGSALLAACGQVPAAPAAPAEKPAEKAEAPKAPAAQPKAAGPVTVKFFYPSWGNQEPYTNFHQDLLALFSARLGGQYQVTIDVATGGFTDALVAQFAAGQQPAAFWVDHQLILPYFKQKLLEDITPFIKGDATFKANEMHPVAMGSLTIQGKNYGLGSASFVGALFYNAKHFTDAGLATPNELMKQGKWTWEALVEGTQKITRADKSVMGIAAGTLPHGTPRLWLGGNGTLEVDDLQFPTRSLYDGAKAVEAVQFWHDILNKYRVADPAFDQSVQGGTTTLLIQGKLGLMFRWTTGLPQFSQITGFNWGIVPFPKGPQGEKPAGDFTFWGWGIASGLKDERVRQGAWEWLKLYNGKESQQLQGPKYLISIPFLPEVFAEWRESVKAKGLRLENPDMITEIRDKYPNQRIMAPDSPKLWEIIQKGLADVWTGKKNAREGCLEVAQMMNNFLKDTPQRV